MARIRTIKPEFPQSESMGRVSRDARLTFILLWTLADDEGRLRGNSRMLASLLFPYDDDAKDLIDEWLTDLEREKCIVRYTVEGASYVQILNWLNHQKIDKPSKSKLPAIGESSRILANPREESSEDQGSRIKEGIKDQGEDLEDSRRAASGEPDSIDKALFVEARKVFGQSIGGKINQAIREKGKPWVLDMIEKCRNKDPEAARAYLAAALQERSRGVVV